MFRNGRDEDQEFGKDENLYRRYTKEHWVNNTFVGAGFKFPKPSVNRQRYGEPEDVIYSDDGKFDSWGVLEFAVETIPARLEDGAGKPFIFFPRHTPDEDNFAHSEIWCECESERGKQAEPTSTVKKKFRTMLSRGAKVKIEAVV